MLPRYITDQLTGAEFILDLTVRHSASIVGIEHTKLVGIGAAGPHRADETADVGDIFTTVTFAVCCGDRADVVAVFDDAFVLADKAADRGVAYDHTVVAAAGHHAALFLFCITKRRKLRRNTANDISVDADRTIVIAVHRVIAATARPATLPPPLTVMLP